MSEKKKILIVDDDTVHLLIARGFLKNEYEIEIARSGEEAVELFKQGKFPDAVLLDMLMPGMDGLETYSKLKGLCIKNIPIAFFTSVKDKHESEIARKLGCADYIMKPYTKDELLKKLNKIMEKQNEDSC